jgi:hypothetical protein
VLEANFGKAVGEKLEGTLGIGTMGGQGANAGDPEECLQLSQQGIRVLADGGI